MYKGRSGEVYLFSWGDSEVLSGFCCSLEYAIIQCLTARIIDMEKREGVTPDVPSERAEVACLSDEGVFELFELYV